MKNRYIVISLLFSFCIFLNAQELRLETQSLLKNIDSYKIIDVREKDKYLKAHIKNALNFPASLSYENTNISGKNYKSQYHSKNFKSNWT